MTMGDINTLNGKMKLGEGNMGICLRLFLFVIAISAFSCSRSRHWANAISLSTNLELLHLV